MNATPPKIRKRAQATVPVNPAPPPEPEHDPEHDPEDDEFDGTEPEEDGASDDGATAEDGSVLSASADDPADVPPAPSAQSEMDAQVIRVAWKREVKRYADSLRAHGKSDASVSRYSSGARPWVEFCVTKQLTPDDMSEHPDLNKLAAEFELYLNNMQPPLSRPSRYMAETVARYLMEEPSQMDPGNNAPIEEEVFEEAVVEEPPQRRGRAPAGNAPQTVRVEVATAPQRGRRTPPPQDPGYAPQSRAPRGPAARLMSPERTQKINLYKVDQNGKEVFINAYTWRELQNNPHQFIRNQVDPMHGNPSGQTTYLVYSLDNNNHEMSNALEINIESEPRESNSPFDQVRDALDLVQQLRGDVEQKNAGASQLLDLAKQRVAQNTGGGMQDIMMLMMMQNLMGGSSGSARNEAELVMKIVDKVKGDPQVITAPPPPPPPAPVESPLTPVVTKLLDVTMSKPAEKPFIEQLAGLAPVVALLKDLGVVGGPKGPDPMVVMLQEQMREQREFNQKMLESLKSGGKANDLQSMVQQFREITETVKTIAPGLNMGGVGSMIQQLLTPAVMQGLGNAFAGGLQRAQTGQLGAPGAPQLPPGPPAQPQAPRQPPKESLPHIEAFRNKAKPDSEQVYNLLLALQAHINDPAWQPLFVPILQSLTVGDPRPAKQMLAEFITGYQRQDLLREDFVNAVFATLVQNLVQIGLLTADQQRALGVGGQAPQLPDQGAQIAQIAPPAQPQPVQEAPQQAAPQQPAQPTEDPQPFHPGAAAIRQNTVVLPPSQVVPFTRPT